MVPYIPMLREDNVRKGFFEHAEFLALRDALPDHLKGFVTFGYKTGWRFSEIAGLTWNQIDLSQNTARLEAGETKDREGRTVWLDDEVKAVIHEQWEKRK
jgi:integrase